MKKREAKEWLEALAWSRLPARKRDGEIPPVVLRVIKDMGIRALKETMPAKPAIKFPKGQKPMSMPALRKKAWAAFSAYIRQKYADLNGLVKCCTCPKVLHWKNMDAGHFESRVNESTLFDEVNVHPQCKECNMPPNNGRRIEYAKFLDERYGAGTAERVTARARRRDLRRDELERILEKYATATPEDA